MEHIEKRIIQGAVERRLSEGLRILGSSNDDTSKASVAYGRMPSSDREQLLGYIASLVLHFVQQHYDKEWQKPQPDCKTAPPEVPAPDAPDALEALGALINATGWPAQRVIDEAVTFLWKAVQHSVSTSAAAAMSAAE